MRDGVEHLVEGWAAAFATLDEVRIQLQESHSATNSQSLSMFSRCLFLSRSVPQVLLTSNTALCCDLVKLSRTIASLFVKKWAVSLN